MYTGNLYCELHVARDVALEKEKKKKKKKLPFFPFFSLSSFFLSLSFSTLFFFSTALYSAALRAMLREIRLRGERSHRSKPKIQNNWVGGKERAYRERG